MSATHLHSNKHSSMQQPTTVVNISTSYNYADCVHCKNISATVNMHIYLRTASAGVYFRYERKLI